MKHDDIFNKQQEIVPPFEFNDQVVRVFDDMINRSVPLYAEMVSRQAQLAARYFQPGTRIYDLGCSNGNFGLCLLQQVGQAPLDMVAIDNSVPMLNAYRQRLEELGAEAQVKMACSDIRDVAIEKASVVVLNLTLQFLPVKDRDALLQAIYDGLVPGGILLLSEKVVHRDEDFSQLQQDFYYQFKKENGYSQLEISQKREALENVLVPETLEQHQQRIEKCGFACMDVWIKWFNFAGMICQKRG